MKKRNGSKIWAFSLILLLSGCSSTVDNMKQSVMDYDWDSVIDKMVEAAVDTILEHDGTEATAGNVAPTPPAVLAVPDQVNLRYWNDIGGDGRYTMAVFVDNVVTLGGGWEVPGFLIETSRVSDEYLSDIFENGEGFSFTYDFLDYDMEQNIIYHSVECRTGGTTSHDSIYFTYTLDGSEKTRAVLPTGVVTDDQGWVVCQPVEYVTFYVPFDTTMTDGGAIYTNIANFHTAREGKYWEKRVYGADFVVEENVVVSMIA